MQAKYLVKDRFIVMNGDDMFHRENIRACLRYTLSCLAQRVRDPSRFGVWVTDNENRVRGFAEKPKEFVSDLVNCGLYVLNEGIFRELEFLQKSERGEYELNEAINNLSKHEDVYCVNAPGYWLSIGYPWDLLDANHHMLSGIRESGVFGEIEPGVTIKGNVCIGQGTVVKSGTYIEGPVYIGKNCIIGPDAYLRQDSVIEDECRIRTEVKNSVVMRGSKAQHHGYIGDSVIGENVNIAAGVIMSNRRHDRQNHKVVVNGKRIDTGRGFLGAFIGDDVRTGVGTLIYPGRKIWPGKTTLPGQVIDRDIMD
jgi:bifunctional UDP-N-acetylglucosamine pyrophosphorylase/glucosamine-1-phosphate N-acetyltransferase